MIVSYTCVCSCPATKCSFRSPQQYQARASSAQNFSKVILFGMQMSSVLVLAQQTPTMPPKLTKQRYPALLEIFIF